MAEFAVYEPIKRITFECAVSGDNSFILPLLLDREIELYDIISEPARCEQDS
jgi:hypothetical protein